MYASAENRNVNVTRDGKNANISIYDILVGDILAVETGDILPVDGIVTLSHDISKDIELKNIYYILAISYNYLYTFMTHFYSKILIFNFRITCF